MAYVLDVIKLKDSMQKVFALCVTAGHTKKLIGFYIQKINWRL